MILRIQILLTAALVAVSTMVGSAQAAIMVTTATESASGDPHVGTIQASNSDLLTGLSPSSFGLFNAADDDSFPALVDGAIDTTTTGATDSERTRLGDDDFLVYDLNVSINTLGYDLTSIATYTR